MSQAKFSEGDKVLIYYFGTGKITEVRGPLGYGGAWVYRVQYAGGDDPMYIEVAESQIEKIAEDD
jgi:hypothetical protein